MSRDALPFVVALHREQERVGQRRPPDRHSWYEATVIGMGKAEADRIRDRGAVEINRLGDQAVTLHGEVSVIDGDIARLDQEPVRGVHRELLNAEEAEQRQTAIAATIAGATRAGSLKHHRVSRMMRWAVRLIPLIDWPVLTMFSADIFNLPWDAALEGGNIVRLLTSVTFGFLGTVVLAAALHKAGTELRQFKNDQGGVAWPSGRGALLTTLLLGGVLSISVGAAVLMGFRVLTEALAAETGLAGGIILGLFFSCVVATANSVVLLTVFRDGSLLTNEVEHLQRQLVPIRMRRLRLQQQRDELVVRIGECIGRAEQLHAETLARMALPIEISHRIVATSRSLHQGCGWSAELLRPDRGAFGLFAPLVTGDVATLDQSLERIAALRIPTDHEGHSAISQSADTPAVIPASIADTPAPGITSAA
ncbi:hypothetical protein OG225_16765 [Nocardia sp. NBC_01377]|uniref:hypothetical protein n=1 Tax=Nocardia sp. NBC_01377 TaxID=2903595 RepID=UPI003246AF7B